MVVGSLSSQISYPSGGHMWTELCIVRKDQSSKVRNRASLTERSARMKTPYWK